MTKGIEKLKANFPCSYFVLKCMNGCLSIIKDVFNTDIFRGSKIIVLDETSNDINRVDAVDGKKITLRQVGHYDPYGNIIIPEITDDYKHLVKGEGEFLKLHLDLSRTLYFDKVFYIIQTVDV